MPIDIDLFTTLSANEQNNLKDKLETALEATQNDLTIVDGKLKAAMLDDSTKHSDLQPLLSYRNEIKQVLDQISSDLNQINRFFQQGANRPTGGTIPGVAFGTGTVGIRKNDAQNRLIPGAKTYRQILDDEQNDFDAVELMKLDAKMRKLEQFRKLEQSKKQTQTQTSKIS